MSPITLVSLVLLLNGSGQIPASQRVPQPCKPSRLSGQAAALVRPILKSRVAAYRDVRDANGQVVIQPGAAEDFMNGLYRLFDDHSRAADEALAVLVRYYVGEDPGEDLWCEIVHRGKEMLPYLAKYHGCMPTTGAEPIPKSLLDIPDQYPELIDVIGHGENCERN